VPVESTLSDGGNTVLREHDLENHLPSEMAAASTPSTPAPAASAPPAPDTEDPGISPTHLGVARSVPHDPSGGPDHALSVAYTYLRDALGSRAAH